MTHRTLLVSLSLALLLALAAGCDDHEPPPELARLPSFELTDAQGRPFTAEDLEGDVWIADFIFTSCPTYCPVLTEKLAEIRDRLEEHRGKVRYLSISVDPETDTPEVLRGYAEDHGIAHDDWVMLTGETEQVTDVVVEGFKTPMGEPKPKKGEEGVYTILHARHFVLIDRDRRIRGYYRTEPDTVDELVRDAEHLAEAEGGK